jgi:hypothetical protein
VKKQTLAKGLHLLFSAVLIAVLPLSIAPAQTARAQATTSTSDLLVTVISAPKHVRDCEVFEVTFTVTNLGPDPASSVFVNVSIPDQFDYTDIQGAPAHLAVGETATFTVVIKVTAFFQGWFRKVWAGVTMTSEPYPDISVDPNLENNRAEAPIKIIGQQRSCQ